MGHGERLHDPAERRPCHRREQKVYMVGHEDIAVQPERVPTLRLAQGVKVDRKILFVLEDRLAVIAAIQGVVDEAFTLGTVQSGHGTEDTLLRSCLATRNMI
jgi:hypothetical protein